MIKIYKEDNEFGEYSLFNTVSGELKNIDKLEFNLYAQDPNVISYLGGGTANHTSFPRRVYFQITRMCNLECDYCYIKANRNGHHVPIDSIKKIAAYLGTKGVMEVRLTGGEPTLHPHFIEIFELFKNNNIFVSVATNGCFDEKVLKYFYTQPRLSLIVSLDGGNIVNGLHRGHSYDKIISNLKKLRQTNKTATIRINTVLTKENISYISEVFEAASEISANSINFIPLRPYPRNISAKEHMIEAVEFRNCINEMVKLKQKYCIPFNTTIKTHFKNEMSGDHLFRSRHACSAGREGFNLDYDYSTNTFFIYGCSYCPASDLSAKDKVRELFIAGKFHIDNVDQIQEIWNNDENWYMFRDNLTMNNVCQTCNENGVRCTGACSIQNLNYESITTAGNPKDEIKRQLKENNEWYCYKNKKEDT